MAAIASEEFKNRINQEILDLGGDWQTGRLVGLYTTADVGLSNKIFGVDIFEYGIFVGYDRVTGQKFTSDSYGFSGGIEAGKPGISADVSVGGFVFSGSLESFSGASAGYQWTTFASVSQYVNRGGDVLTMFGGSTESLEISIAVSVAVVREDDLDYFDLRERFSELPSGEPSDIRNFNLQIYENTDGSHTVWQNWIRNGNTNVIRKFNVDIFGNATLALSSQESYRECFLAGTMIEMADGSRKPIEDIRPEDQVMAFDGDGKKVAGRVTRTMTNESKIILDFHGTFVTPGHVYYCAGGKFEGGFAPIIDILRDDGVVQHEDNTLIRASTGCVVGSELDAEIWVLGIEADANGVYHEKIRKKLRLGTRFIIPDGSSVSIAEDLQKIGMRACADGFVEHIVTGQRALYQWPVGGQMPPNPEDYVLQRSGTTLEDIYRAGEWEGQRPQMPPPMIRDGGAVTPVSERTLMAMPRNVPMAMREGTPPDASPKLNRKARKAMEAKRRKAAKQTRGSQTLH